MAEERRAGMLEMESRVASLEAQTKMIHDLLKEVRAKVDPLPSSFPCTNHAERIVAVETNGKWLKAGLFGGISGFISLSVIGVKTLLGF